MHIACVGPWRMSKLRAGLEQRLCCTPTHPVCGRRVRNVALPEQDPSLAKQASTHTHTHTHTQT